MKAENLLKSTDSKEEGACGNTEPRFRRLFLFLEIFSEFSLNFEAR